MRKNGANNLNKNHINVNKIEQRITFFRCYVILMQNFQQKHN